MENVVKTFEQLEKLYDEYVDMEYDNSLSIYEVDYKTYHLYLEEGWIVEHSANGSAACNCAYCYHESYEVVAWVEGFEPTDEEH